MYFEINISLNGNHLFATHQRSIETTDKLIQVFKTLNLKFPESEGYQITTTFYSDSGFVRSRAQVNEAIETNNIKNIKLLFRTSNE